MGNHHSKGSDDSSSDSSSSNHTCDKQAFDISKSYQPADPMTGPTYIQTN